MSEKWSPLFAIRRVATHKLPKKKKNECLCCYILCCVKFSSWIGVSEQYKYCMLYKRFAVKAVITYQLFYLKKHLNVFELICNNLFEKLLTRKRISRRNVSVFVKRFSIKSLYLFVACVCKIICCNDCDPIFFYFLAWVYVYTVWSVPPLAHMDCGFLCVHY